MPIIQYAKYCIRYSFFLFGNISNTFLCIRSFNINAYLPSLISALNSSNDITFGKLTTCLGIPKIISSNSFSTIKVDILFFSEIYFMSPSESLNLLRNLDLDNLEKIVKGEFVKITF